MSRNTIIFSIVTLIFIAAFLMIENSSLKKQIEEDTKSYSELVVSSSNYINSRESFDTKAINNIIQDKRFSKFIKKNKSGKKLIITLEAPVKDAQAFYKKVLNSKAIINSITLEKLKNNKRKITVEVSK